MSLHPSRVVPWLAAVIGAAHGRARQALLRARSPVKRLQAENSALREENALLQAEADLLRARIERIPPRQRPRYAAWMRLEILWHRHRYGLSLPETARAFLLGRQTISRWEADAREPSPGLVGTRGPVNKLADIVGDLVRRLKVEQPRWGTRRIAQTLVRLGVRVSRSSVQRLVRRPPPPSGARAGKQDPPASPASRGPLRAKRPNHVWLIDLFFYEAPFRLRRIPVLGILDLFVYENPPTAKAVKKALRNAFGRFGKPGHIVSDRGPPFPAKSLTRCSSATTA